MEKKKHDKITQPWDDYTIMKKDNPDDFGGNTQGDDDTLLVKDNPDDFKFEGREKEK